MSAKIFLTFSNIKGSDPQEFVWDVRGTSLAQRWMGEMANALKFSHRLREQRFAGWVTRNEDLELIIDQLNEAVMIINAYYGDRYNIPERAHSGMNQEILNALHHHFELLMGQSWNRSELTKGIPDNVLVAVRRLNDRVHDYEQGERSRECELKGEIPLRTFQCTLVPYVQRPLLQEDFASFSYTNDVGDMVTNYCQLGKTWLEAYQDCDIHIHPENIAPLRFYSSGFNCYFSEHSPSQSENLNIKVKEFILKKAEANNWKTDPDDVKHALGHSVYASLPSDSPLLKCSETERVALIRDHANISAIRLVSGAQEVYREFPDPFSYLGNQNVPDFVYKNL
jgi:hypothetical protein